MWGYGAPDFAAVASAYGLPARSVVDPAGVAEAIAWLMADTSAPALLHVRLTQNTRVSPKVAFGNPVFVMDPAPEGGAGE